MKKQTYQKPDAQLVRFENEDIITASGNCDHKFSNNNCDHGNSNGNGGKNDADNQWLAPGEM